MNRQQRRKANSGKPKGLVRITTEIFTTPNLGDEVVNLDVSRMRQWAEQHLELEKVRIVADHLNRLISGGTVTEDRVMGHTMNQFPKPILLCEHPDGLGDEIVDGNHTYVATAISWAQCVEAGLVSPSVTPFVLGYGLTPAQWQQFVVPSKRLPKRG